MSPIYVLINRETGELWHPLGHNGKPKYVKRGVQAYTSASKALASAMQFHPKPDPAILKAVEYIPNETR